MFSRIDRLVGRCTSFYCLVCVEPLTRETFHAHAEHCIHQKVQLWPKDIKNNLIEPEPRGK